MSSALDYITVKGFKSIASIEKLPLSSINLVIGANGSGKSNFIGLFAFLHAIREGQLQDYVRRAGGADQVLHYGSKTTKAIQIHISFGGEVNQYKLELSPTNDDSLYVANERVYYWEKKNYSQPHETRLHSADGGREAGISEPARTRVADWVQHRIGLWRVYHVHDTSTSSPMRKTSKINDNRYLRPDGSNLAAFLFLLREKHRETYELIRNCIRSVTPFFGDFILNPDRRNEDVIRLEWRHKNSNQYFDASALSDGTLRFIVLATLFLQPLQFRPSVILVDEPELGLHPYAITMLASLVKQAAKETQVILSTQSALLLDHFTPEDVLVAERVNDGTTLKRLKNENLESWLEEYSLGQLWEKNEIGGRPVPD